MPSIPLINQGDYIVYDKEGYASEYFYALQVEQFARDFISAAVVAGASAGGLVLNAITDPVSLDDLEPKEVYPRDVVMIYQARLGLDRPNIFLYIEQLLGSPRRGTFKDPAPLASNSYRAGHTTGRESPEHNPYHEIFVRYNEFPGIRFYNNYAFDADSKLSVRGGKIAALDLELASDARLQSLGLGGAKRANEIIKLLKEDRIPHSHILVYGLNDLYK